MATPLPFKIAQTVQQELNAANALFALLQQESDALGSRDTQLLATIIERKNQELVNLAQGANKRFAILTEQKLAHNQQNWILLLGRCRDEKLLQQWRALEQQIKACKQENETNGKLLARSQRVLAKLTGVLRGQAESNQELYNRKGSHSAAKRNLTYAQA